MTTLVCYACGATAPLGERKRCSCGEPLWVETDASDFSWPDGPLRGVWRYSDLLPVSATSGVAAAAGGTPLVRTPALDEFVGCRLYCKDESENPTGTFKDRGSAVGVAWAEANDREWVGTVSHGNMAISTAAHAAGAGLNALVLVPEDVPAPRLAAIGQYDPEILRVSGDYGRLYYETLATESPVEFVNSDTPLRVAGQKTTALEICEAFTRGAREARSELLGEQLAPDAIVLPTSSGGHASAAWKALRELREAGLLDAESVPRLYLVQAAACDPIATAFREGADEVSPVEGGETIAYSIANADPPSGTRALAAVRDTDGAVVSVPDDDIRLAKRRLATEAGFCVEAASATAFAGIRRLTDAGELAADDSVVAVVTGTGFRELDADSTATELVELADLSERLDAVTE
ncbi:threonine synthase [Halorussus halophilus]|uniref:threonine synthase n=1 Tax=Halorussus halophilus TaxID=2650975 RepID=UPI001301138A|nr:threonine synthase [Halorussus halophilus]